MAYLVYNYTSEDTMGSVANMFGTTVQELARINNIPNPITNTLNDKNLNGSIVVPQLLNGKESYENRDRSYLNVQSNNTSLRSRRPTYQRSFSRVGFASDRECYIVIGIGSASRIYYFPCFPQNFSDSRSVSYTPVQPLGRSEPFEIYGNSGPRTVNVTFTMHREMLNDNNLSDKVNQVDTLVYAVQSATYPLDYGSHIPPKVRLVLGNACDIVGIIANDVTATWSDVIIDNRYQMVELSFTITEITGDPITYDMTNRIYGY